MLIRSTPAFPVRPSEITPETIYRDRRRFLKDMGLVATGLALGGVALAGDGPRTGSVLSIGKHVEKAGGEKLTEYDVVTSYNNYYEFGTDKSDPAANAGTLKTRPWTVAVDGECEQPGRLGIDDLIKLYPLEERIYRHRCVEGWSIVVPWAGFALAPLLARFKPTSKARYVSFTTLADPVQMPQLRRQVLDWPYREGLRMDEAQHPLTFMAVGLYGRTLPNQNGAPLRLVVPWKYGFKSIKSIVGIHFGERQPYTSWNAMAPSEYGFYSNVNPEVDHPRWSQKTERRLGEFFKRPTLMFNGYPEVASLYSGLDLKRNF